MRVGEATKKKLRRIFMVYRRGGGRGGPELCLSGRKQMEEALAGKTIVTALPTLQRFPRLAPKNKRNKRIFAPFKSLGKESEGGHELQSVAKIFCQYHDRGVGER